MQNTPLYILYVPLTVTYHHFNHHLHNISIIIIIIVMLGIYFLASFPLFYRMDEYTNADKRNKKPIVSPYSIHQVIMEVMAASMIVLLLLDFCRIAFGIDLNISGTAYYVYKP
jgi:hypothetical protein